MTPREKAQARAQRNRMISETDFVMLPDSDYAQAQRDEMKVYRQALRDITAQFDAAATADDLVWPVPPAWFY
jgi:hypothetical protein